MDIMEKQEHKCLKKESHTSNFVVIWMISMRLAYLIVFNIEISRGDGDSFAAIEESYK